MTLQSAKNKVTKARKTLAWAKSNGLPTRNYPAIRANECRAKLSGQDLAQFEAWLVATSS